MYCRACGTKLLEGAAFCGNCGAPVTNATAQGNGGPTTTGPAADQPTTMRTPRIDPAANQPTTVRPRPLDPAVMQPAPPYVTPSAGPAAGPPVVRPVAPGALTPPPAQTPPAPPVPGGYAPPPAPGYGPVPASGYGAPPRPPRRNGRLGLWIGLAATVIVIIAAAVAVWLLVVHKHDDVALTTTTQVAKNTTTSTAAPTTTTVAPSTTTSASTSTTVTLPSGEPGDSAGTWAEVTIPGLPADAYAVAVSDKALLVDVQTGDGTGLYAYLFDSKKLIQLEVDGSDFGAEQLDGLTAVWWEGTYDDQTDTTSDEHIYAYVLPDGPKVEIAGGGRAVFYPQIAGNWVTWVETERWPESPDEYSLSHVFGVTIDGNGNPKGDAIELVPGATGYVEGDTSWMYSLSTTQVAWENATAVDTLEPGIYTTDLASGQASLLAKEAWRPSSCGTKIVYVNQGLVTADLETGTTSALDPQGDFATAAPTFAVYFRSNDSDGATSYDIVARGYTGGYEQTLGSQADPPWFSAALAASAHYVAFIDNGTVRVFRWQGPATY